MQISRSPFRISFLQPAIPYMYLINWLSNNLVMRKSRVSQSIHKTGYCHFIQIKIICNGHVQKRKMPTGLRRTIRISLDIRLITPVCALTFYVLGTQWAAMDWVFKYMYILWIGWTDSQVYQVMLDTYAYVSQCTHFCTYRICANGC